MTGPMTDLTLGQCAEHYIAGLVGWIALPLATPPVLQAALFLLLVAFLAAAAEEVTGDADAEA